MKKKHNPYNLQQVMEKYNLPEEQAAEKIKNLKCRTSGSIASFISRYGEVEGKKRYDEFRQKSAITEDRYIEKYGEVEGKKKYKEYCKSKGLGLEQSIKRYGEVEGKKRYDEFIKRKTIENSTEYHLNKHGIEYLTELNHKKGKSRRIEYIMDKHNLSRDEAEMYRSKACGVTKEKFIKKYGLSEGLIRWNNWIKVISPVYIFLKRTYDNYEELYSKYLVDRSSGIRKYKKCLNQKFLNNIGTRSGSVSKSSISIMNKLELSINRKLQYGSKSEEFKLYDIEKSKMYSYDGYDAATKTIIEYHGRVWHPNPNWPTELKEAWTNPFGYSYDYCLDRDRNKEDFARTSGYNVIIIYEDEVNTKSKRLEKIIEIRNMLHDS